MNIKLMFIHPNNIGNLMMTAVFIQNFNRIATEQFGDKPFFYADVLDEIELERVRNALPEDLRTQIQMEYIFDKKRRGIVWKLSKLFYLPIEIKFSKKNYDSCIVLGGDCISQYYSSQVFISDMIKIGSISKKIPTFLVGQTMGPFEGYRKELVKKCLSKCNIF